MVVADLPAKVTSRPGRGRVLSIDEGVQQMRLPPVMPGPEGLVPCRRRPADHSELGSGQVPEPPEVTPGDRRFGIRGTLAPVRPTSPPILPYQAFDRSAHRDIQACMAIPAATVALMLRVDPNWAIDTVTGADAGGVGDSRTLLPEHQQAVAGQHGVFQSHRPGNVVDGDHGQTRTGGEGEQFGGAVVVSQPLVAVGHQVLQWC